MTENDILGFDPQSLSVFNQDEKPQSQSNSLIYKTRPAESKSDDGHYYSTIKVVYNPFNFKQSFLEQQSYGLQDANGWFSVISSLTNGDTSCPIFKAWKKCHYAEVGSDLWRQAAPEKDGGRALFDKRYARYCVIQVIEDKNQPDLVGKFMLWKLPKAVYELVTNKMHPSVESKKSPIPVMDYLFGRSIELEVVPGEGNVGDERYNRDTKYIAELSDDVVTCINPDGSPLLNDAEQEILDNYVALMKEVWKERDPEKRNELKLKADADPNTKELRKLYNEKILPQIKEWCPNLIEVLGYKPWTDDIKARVQHWIDIVLSCNDPITAESTPKSATNIGTTENKTTENKEVKSEASIETKSDTTSDSSDDTSDLPF